MKLIFRTAFQNIIRSGLRTWLNAVILSVVFLIIIFYDGLLTGWDERAQRDSIDWEFGGGHLVHPLYDPYDPFSIQVSHGVLSDRPIQPNLLTPILIWPAFIYPEQVQIPVILKGIPRDQKVLKIPTEKLQILGESVIPVLIGKLMAEDTGLQTGDTALLQWRDKNRTFDAISFRVVGVFDTDVPTVDSGQVYLDIDDLWEMTQLHEQATYWVGMVGIDWTSLEQGKWGKGWEFKSQEELLKPFNDLMAVERASSLVTNLLLFLLALLAIFDTQVIAVFRRQREIGTYVAMGMTRVEVMGIFTLEGGIYSLLGMGVGTLIGIPLFTFLSQVGIPMDQVSGSDYGIPLGDKIFPVFHIGNLLVMGVIFFAMTTVVAFIPARKIVTLNPVEALKGRAF